MKRLTALAAAVLMLFALAACTSAPAETTAPAETAASIPTYPESDNPVTFLSLSLGENYEDIKTITVFANDDGTARVDYVGDVRKIGDLDASVFHAITGALADSGLAALNGQESWTEGEANGSMYIEMADGSCLTANFGGEIPQEYQDGYAKMDAFFAQLTADVPEYVPQPTVMDGVSEPLLTELQSIISGSGMASPDAFIISPVAKDEYFAYTLGLSTDAGVADAAQCAPMMMTTAYSLSIVQLEEGADAEAICADFAANVDWQKWVCVMPSDAMIAVKDNLVLCLVADGELYAQTSAGIEAAGWTVAETMENPAV